MPKRISVALAIHNHQPVGNFGWVIAEAYDRAYRPMLEALERHPGVRLSLHYSGPLLEWLARERPDFVGRLRAAVERGQVELLGGGYFEPVLASLPERDRVGQLRRMTDELGAMFGVRPRGAWLAERVWEPDVPGSLVAGGYDWTILDDAHFRAASIPEAGLWGPYTTEDQGHVVTVFGTEQGLRYRIPFREVDEVIGYLSDHATEDGMRVGMMGDDGEKFGVWPTTWEHCWGERRWVDRFFEALERNGDWLATVTPSAWLAEHPPIGRVYVPTGSYAEMGGWALPADEGLLFAETLRRAIVEERPEARWLRGAFWRNFQVKYREVNDLHKQMLRASDKVAAMADGPAKAAALDHLYRGQSNDCYWHGLFGGIYLSHMRLATHEQLIAAEDLADAALGSTTVAERRDLDLDGVEEVLLADPGQVVAIDPAEGGGIGQWDVRAVRHALASVMRRRPEAYHETLRAGATEPPTADDARPASIHERVAATEPELAAGLAYDGYERRSGLVRFAAAGASAGQLAAGAAEELGDFVTGAFELVGLEPRRATLARRGVVAPGGRPSPVRVEKTVTLGGDRRRPSLTLDVLVENGSDVALDLRLALEFNLTMLGGGANPAAWWEVDGVRSRHDGTGTARQVRGLGQGNDHVGVSVWTTVEPPADAAWSPIETISSSEAGFERAYQGSALVLSWPLGLGPGERTSVRIGHAVTAAYDRTAEELASG